MPRNNIKVDLSRIPSRHNRKRRSMAIPATRADDVWDCCAEQDYEVRAVPKDAHTSRR